jgi:peptidoglycan hydrolase-like protein with peptidoglycan-binding domain
MRTALAATALTLALAGTTVAQTSPSTPAPTPPAVASVKPKPVATTPVRPAGPTAADAAAVAERTAIQSDLAWLGEYNGVINGEPGERTTAAIKTFQKNNGGKPTGVLTPQERQLLSVAAKKPQADVGWKIVTDMVTGARIGIPAKLIAQQTSDANGTRWTSSTGTIQIQLARRKEAAPTTAKLAEQERKEPAGRRIDYSAVKPDFFVVSGMQGLKKFYVRGQVKDAEVRILTILYDQATEGTMEPVTIAMSSAFNPFPTSAQTANSPPRRNVEYATGVVASADGAVLTDRLATDNCLSVVVAGYGNADRVAEDKERDLALLRIYGARDLKPLGLGGASAKSTVDLTGIADPQNQGGGNAISAVRAAIGASNELTPAPALGFSGAPARDADGSFAGISLLKQVVMAGPAPGAAQAGLVPADAVRGFLKASKVSFNEATGGDAKASVVRVICVRK